MTDPICKDSLSVARAGVIDVGSNSVRMVVFDGAARSPAYFYDEKVLCELGRGLRTTGVLNPEGRVRAMAALTRFRVLAERMGVTDIRVVATAAVRDAEDGAAFCAEVKDKLGLSMQVISGQQEASFSAKGVLLGWPDASGLVCDIGGASMELAVLDKGQIVTTQTSPLGPLAVQDLELDAVGLRGFVDRTVSDMARDFPETVDTLYLVGGSWRAVARFHMDLVDYPLHVIHDYTVSPNDLNSTLDYLISTSIEELLARELSVSSSRLSLLPTAAVALRGVLERFAPNKISISSYGLREGMLYEKMPARLKKRDPLIEAARAQESTNARFPGFGDTLFEWIKPVFAQAPEQRLRLIRAACLLHDVTWRAHPDYRAAVCFEGATRANLGAIDHLGRVYLAHALFYRYKAKSKPAEFVAMSEMLSTEDQNEAVAVGRAMRLGAMMSGADIAQMGQLSLDDRRVLLTIDKAAAGIFGEVVEKRLIALATTLGRTAEISIGTPVK